MRTSRLEQRLDELARELARRFSGAGGAAPVETRVPVEPPPRAARGRPRSAPPPPAPTSGRADPGATGHPARGHARPPRPPVPRPAPPPPPRRAAAAPTDFATNLGPKILVATGALAFMVFLGPVREVRVGQQLGGPGGPRAHAAPSSASALLAAGMRLMRREYRPLGQGLAGAGLAGLYTSAFARPRLLRPRSRARPPAC